MLIVWCFNLIFDVIYFAFLTPEISNEERSRSCPGGDHTDNYFCCTELSYWFTSTSQSDHYIRYVCVCVCLSVCVSVCLSVQSITVGFDLILMKLGYVFDINV